MSSHIDTENKKNKGRRSLPMLKTYRGEMEPYDPGVARPEVKKNYLPRLNGDEATKIFAYEIEDKNFPTFRVIHSANAWWMDKYKVEKIIDAYKMHCTDPEACYYAGISLSQLRYFKDTHPEFKQIINLCKQELGFYARRNIARDIKSGKYSLRSWEYLQKKHKGELGDSIDVTSGGKPIKQAPTNTVVFMDFSRPGQKEPEVIDPEKIYEVNPDNDAASK